jgi:hypothetical protein
MTNYSFFLRHLKNVKCKGNFFDHIYQLQKQLVLYSITYTVNRKKWELLSRAKITSSKASYQIGFDYKIGLDFLSLRQVYP